MSPRAALPQPTAQLSMLERATFTRLKQEGLPLPEIQVKVVEGRRFRADFCWADHKVILETHGGTWNRGGHVRGKQYASDCEKANLAQLNGFIYLQATTDQVHNGTFIEWVRRALELRGGA